MELHKNPQYFLHGNNTNNGFYCHLDRLQLLLQNRFLLDWAFKPSKFARKYPFVFKQTRPILSPFS